MLLIQLFKQFPDIQFFGQTRIGLVDTNLNFRSQSGQCRDPLE